MMNEAEAVQGIAAAVERAGCQLVRKGDRLGVMSARRLPAAVSEFLAPWRAELLAATAETTDPVPEVGPDCVHWIGRARPTTFPPKLRDTGSPEFQRLAAVAFAAEDG